MKESCLPLGMILLAFHVSQSLKTKGHVGSEKKPFCSKFLLSKCTNLEKKSLCNHSKAFDTKGPMSPFAEGNSNIVVIFEAFTHYLSLKPKPHCNAYYAYTRLYKNWIVKFGLPKILVTGTGTEFINNEIIALCHLYNNKYKPRTSHAPRFIGLVEGMNTNPYMNILDVS